MSKKDMSSDYAQQYKKAGVDINAGAQLVKNIKLSCKETQGSQVLHARGSFAALFALGDISRDYKKPVLVSGTDGIGTKLLLAKEHNAYVDIGQDCVAMCVNDIICHGAKPLFFLDYIACGKLSVEVAQEIITSIARACKKSHCALVGGETAEMPGMYQVGDYDVAGFALGIVDEDSIISGDVIKETDVLIALPSSGLHSNGFSLIRKLYPNTTQQFNGQALYKTLLTPTSLYSTCINNVLDNIGATHIHGLAHITGGGIFENIERILPLELSAVIQEKNIPKQAIFEDIKKRTQMSVTELFHTFNMGVGFVIVVDKHKVDDVLHLLQRSNPFVLGDVIKRTSNNETILIKQ